MRIDKIDTERLGSQLILLPLISMSMGENTATYTLKNTLTPSEGDYSNEFISDLLRLSTDEMIDKWYGGQEKASSLLAQYKE